MENSNNNASQNPRTARISLLSTATIYNFREGRVLIKASQYDTPLFKQFIGKNEINDFHSTLLFPTEMDLNVPFQDIQDISMGHWIQKEFIDDIREILSEVKYDQECFDIVILLLLYKYLNYLYTLEIKENKKVKNEMEFIEFIKAINPKDTENHKLIVSYNKKKHHFNGGAVGLIHTVFNDYFNTESGKENFRLMELLTKEDFPVLLKKLHGKNWKNSMDHSKRDIVRLLFSHLFKYCKEQNTRCTIIGFLLDKTTKGLSWKGFRRFDGLKNKKTYDEINEAYFNNFRRIIAGLD